MRGPLRQTSTARLTGSDNSDKQQLALSFYLSIKVTATLLVGRVVSLLLTTYYLLLTSLSLGGEYRIRTDDPLLAKQVL